MFVYTLNNYSFENEFFHLIYIIRITVSTTRAFFFSFVYRFQSGGELFEEERKCEMKTILLLRWFRLFDAIGGVASFASISRGTRTTRSSPIQIFRRLNVTLLYRIFILCQVSRGFISQPNFVQVVEWYDFREKCAKVVN